MGQTEKNSVRAYVFRFALKLGHRSTHSACLKGAKSDHSSQRACSWVSLYRRHSHEPKRAPSAAPPPPDYGGAAGAATARAAGSSLAPRKEGSAHSDNRLGSYFGHSEGRAGTDL